jgi:hypothetical protein
VVANVFQLPHFVATNKYHAASAASILLAAKTKTENRILRNYMVPRYVLEPLPKLVDERKDIFTTPLGRTFISNEGFPIKPGTYSGFGFRMPEFDDGTIVGLVGWSSGRAEEFIDHIIIYSDGKVVGVGIPAALQIASNGEEARLMRPGYAVVRRWAPLIADAYGITTGWVGLAIINDGAPNLSAAWKAYDAIAWTKSGDYCRILLK